jgi:threonine/homoserine/homoserine lactone efflux protein
MNPKATLFFLSVFTQVISPETSHITQGIYGIIMASTAGIWFLTLTTIINFQFIQKYISQIQYYLNKIM